jgi:hypothetical protein
MATMEDGSNQAKGRAVALKEEQWIERGKLVQGKNGASAAWDGLIAESDDSVCL